jgi:hypothetical protein
MECYDIFSPRQFFLHYYYNLFNILTFTGYFSLQGYGHGGLLHSGHDRETTG